MRRLAIPQSAGTFATPAPAERDLNEGARRRKCIIRQSVFPQKGKGGSRPLLEPHDRDALPSDLIGEVLLDAIAQKDKNAHGQNIQHRVIALEGGGLGVLGLPAFVKALRKIKIARYCLAIVAKKHTPLGRRHERFLGLRLLGLISCPTRPWERRRPSSLRPPPTTGRRRPYPWQRGHPGKGRIAARLAHPVGAVLARRLRLGAVAA